MKNFSRWIGRACALAVGLTCLAVEASQVTQIDGIPIRWETSQKIQLELAGPLPEIWNAARWMEQAEGAISIWNSLVACHAPQFVIEGSSDSAIKWSDNRNTIGWIADDWEEVTGMALEVPAFTDIRVETTSHTAWIREVDVYLNAEAFAWTWAPRESYEITSTDQYLKAALAHELGHALGLDHPCEYGGLGEHVPDCSRGSYDTAVMFPFASGIEPEAVSDDVVGLCSLYQYGTGGNGGTTTGTGGAESEADLAGEGAECESSADCIAPFGCLGGRCTLGTAAVGSRCSRDVECLEGLCLNGGCRSSCLLTDTCAFSQECSEDSGVCGVELALVGDACSTPAECVTGACVAEGEASYCTRECDAKSDCPEEWKCEALDSVSVCQRRTASSGCSIYRRGSGAVLGHVLVFCALVLGLRRRVSIGER